MSSMFDSAVYQMRQSVPCAMPQVTRFMAMKALESDASVKLTVHYRHSVKSRLWWVLEWNEYDGPYSVSAQDWDLCFWRAIQVHKQKERQRELEGKPVTRGVGFYAAEAKGWEGGDGI